MNPVVSKGTRQWINPSERFPRSSKAVVPLVARKEASDERRSILKGRVLA